MDWAPSNPVLEGLSPRWRGNPVIQTVTITATGSIPALAGQPRCDTILDIPLPVYPRAGGATPQGNASRMIWTRSIPALAGQPHSKATKPCLAWVYPRAGGATDSEWRQELTEDGLSPRWRGNRLGCFRVRPRERSIPALAGQP